MKNSNEDKIIRYTRQHNAKYIEVCKNLIARLEKESPTMQAIPDLKKVVAEMEEDNARFGKPIETVYRKGNCTLTLTNHTTDGLCTRIEKREGHDPIITTGIQADCECEWLHESDWEVISF